MTLDEMEAVFTAVIRGTGLDGGATGLIRICQKLAKAFPDFELKPPLTNYEGTLRDKRTNEVRTVSLFLPL